MRKKVGNVYYKNKKFPLWLDNSISIDYITIKIYDDDNIPQYIVSDLKFNKKLNSDNDKSILYAILDLKNVKQKLEEISNFMKADIDYKKVDEFLFKIEKQLVVNRIG